MSAQLTWRALDEAGGTQTAANRAAFLSLTLVFSGQTFFWPRNLPQSGTILSSLSSKGDSSPYASEFENIEATRGANPR